MARFITVTETQGMRQARVNVAHIILYMASAKAGVASVMTVSNQSPFDVRETVEQLDDLIAGPDSSDC